MLVAQVVVFDIDGTLMDHAASARTALESWAASLGHSMSPDLASTWTQAEHRHFTAWHDGRISFAEQRRRRLRDVLPLMGERVGSDAQLDEMFEGYLSAYESAWQPYPDVTACLEALTAGGRTLAVLSNGSDEQQRKKLQRIGVADYFSHVLTAESLSVAKPDPGAFQATAQALGCGPDECLNVGDDYALDVVAARAAGWSAIHLDRTAQNHEATAITSLADLPGLLA